MNHNKVIAQFPSLERSYKRKKLVYLDGPAGTQVPTSVIDAISDYYKNCNANAHGSFVTTHETDAMMNHTRQKIADFLGAAGPQTISWGANMTTLNYSLARAIGRVLQAGDEILITQLDHEANRSPWLSLRELGIVVREVALLSNGTLDYEDFQSKINERTRLVAMGYASNIFGTVNDVAKVRKWTYEVGAWLLLDAVHYAPHFPMDVEAIGCDFLLCSVYKFYGPHIGILYSKEGLLNRLPTDRLRTAPQAAPYSIETGTQNHAALAGAGATLDFIASLGRGASYREKILGGMKQIRETEKKHFKMLWEGLAAIPKVTIFGLPAEDPMRTPTVSFTFEGMTAAELCERLGEKGICAWSGHFYAIRATEVLGLLERGGVTRMGLSVYNTADDIERTLKVLREL